MKRRAFLQVLGGAAGGYALTQPSVLSAESAAAAPTEEKVAGMPRRLLGRTGQKISVVGFPGLALVHYDQARGTEGLHKAFERGINYFDVAPAYGGGEAETKMGIGLQGLDRSRYFLACKTKKRDKEGARLELERSLKALKTDHFDLYQFHHLVTPDEVKQALGPGGALETFLKAKEEGKLKYIGFSAHTTKAALEALQGYRFDTAMFPISFAEWFTRGFGKPVLELAKQQGVGVLAIKAMSWGAWPQGMTRNRQWWYRSVEEPKEVSLALRFTLSQPAVVAAIPPSFLDLLDKLIDAAKDYQPVTAAELAELEKMAASTGSIFAGEERRVALNLPSWPPIHPDSPHECCPGHFA